MELEWILDYVRSTKGTHVYSDGAGHTIYVPKYEIGGAYPLQIKVVVTGK